MSIGASLFSDSAWRQINRFNSLCQGGSP